MTGFFVPGALPGQETERAYGVLRASAQAQTACTIRSTRIEALTCRRGGTDSQLRVGERDPSGGGTVRAIFATRDGYTVVCEDGYVDLTKRQTYEAIPFDQ